MNYVFLIDLYMIVIFLFRVLIILINIVIDYLLYLTYRIYELARYISFINVCVMNYCV
jgi:hypothetical protein